ncbi:mannosyl-oligosaccharide 1,2-alpha-mannosidase IA [Thecamonas trahens ATCC 50062]|uniref:alpha-1,2-Mannosidase n=1 Tax=Thecamonas trahens ATCC 50062 TaxID=461836 RepID=A0A0L0D8E3_THETB|nr:mannosyl-oligosaccharide 1,2-alpha-mannosidase IA [Thecamonas trahens ATCC 50062]KNC48599.1 mannosyl-oligosaccharide 1,2-alpha-mannosidase IA [Thecamonas trahens ATCC 50062]|eukprot:XP_013762655.1 mannosyl-oligosaccharide 1,2-alpha-mannosidase IA [Thecamonas trahens ATCC 50062]
MAMDGPAADAARRRVEALIAHAVDGYMAHAAPADELRSLSCRGMETFGGYALTLVDALDTLLMIGDAPRARLALDALRASHLAAERFALDATVSVFETNIRIVGGLLSAHELAPAVLGPSTSVDDLLDLAVALVDRMLPAFDTHTGIPFCSIHLVHGVAPDETPETSTACGGSMLLEFGVLSALTGEAKYYAAARRSWLALAAAAVNGLVGSHINVQTATWTEAKATIASNVDSFYEYGLKAGLLFGDHEILDAALELIASAESRLARGPWYVSLHLTAGKLIHPVGPEHLGAFWPGLLTLAGAPARAADIAMAYTAVLRKHGMLPERFDLINNAIPEATHPGSAAWHLRPELVESYYYLARADRDSARWLLHAETIVNGLEDVARSPCGFASVKDVRSRLRLDRMESFVLSETLKYAWLVFAAHPRADLSHLPPQMRALVADDGFILTTEGHPIPLLGRDWYGRLVASGALLRSRPSSVHLCNALHPAGISPPFAGWLALDTAFHTGLADRDAARLANDGTDTAFRICAATSTGDPMWTIVVGPDVDLSVVPAPSELDEPDHVIMTSIADIDIASGVTPLFAWRGPVAPAVLPLHGRSHTRYAVTVVEAGDQAVLAFPPALAMCWEASGARFGLPLQAGAWRDVAVPTVDFTCAPRPGSVGTALARRGGCTFVDKAAQARAQLGAELLFVANSPGDAEFIDMIGVGGADEASLPTTLMVSAEAGDELLALARAGPRIQLRLRRLVGERHLAFQGTRVANIVLLDDEGDD